MSAPLTASTSAHVIAFVGATPTHQRSIERVMSHLIAEGTVRAGVSAPVAILRTNPDSPFSVQRKCAVLSVCIS